MRVNYAELEYKSAYLSSDFGVELAIKKTGWTLEQLREKLGVKSKGPRKGLLHGTIRWVKVVKGGWVKTGSYNDVMMRGTGFVAGRGCYNFEIFDKKNEPIWAGEKRI
jgi:hypothetical protein